MGKPASSWSLDSACHVLAIPVLLTEVAIRDRRISIPRDPAIYASKGITLQEPPSIQTQELMRVLLPEHREGMLATEAERRQLIPHDLPLFARLVVSQFMAGER